MVRTKTASVIPAVLHCLYRKRRIFLLEVVLIDKVEDNLTRCIPNRPECHSPGFSLSLKCKPLSAPCKSSPKEKSAFGLVAKPHYYLIEEAGWVLKPCSVCAHGIPHNIHRADWQTFGWKTGPQVCLQTSHRPPGHGDRLPSHWFSLHESIRVTVQVLVILCLVMTQAWEFTDQFDLRFPPLRVA